MFNQQLSLMLIPPWKSGKRKCLELFFVSEEAIELANDTKYGLASAIMSEDFERCERFTKAFQTGIIWINCSQPSFHQLPWGGKKRSGFGRDLGEWLREFPHNGNLVATLTDSSDVLIWNIKAQADREAVCGAVHSSPLLALRGHEDKAEFALAVSSELFVLSGGTGKNVLFWNIEDHISTLKLTGDRSTSSRQIFKGHTDTVKDVQFRRSSPREFCSVGDDSCLILWDARDWNPAVKVEKAHGAAIRSVDWNRCDENYIITGSADKLIRLFDRRMVIKDGIGSPVNTFEDHTAAVLCVQWCPDKSSMFGSSSEDGTLNVWDHKMVNKTHAERPHLYMRHAGHRGGKVVDFHWNESDPWTIAGISDDFGTGSGGAGKLQIWRLTGWLYESFAAPDPQSQE